MTEKLSHHKRNTNDRMIEWLCQSYENIFEDGSGKMLVIISKIHEYLGMTLDYTVCGQVRITMTSYIEDILSALDKAEPKGNKFLSACRNFLCTVGFLRRCKSEQKGITPKRRPEKFAPAG